MKIGIATLFAPSNYGNALQMLSLHRYLIEHGHQAEVLRHWLSSGCSEVNYYHNRIRSMRGLLQFVIDVLSCGGALSNFTRERKIKKWVSKHYRFSELSGADGEFPVSKLDYDAIIAGSDQIWNPKYPWPEFNLLKDVPESITRIAYAASFGTNDLALFDASRFVPALTKFKAISMRESSATKIVNEVFGLPADLVCDPTLLHTSDEWCALLNVKKDVRQDNSYVVYLVTPDFGSHWRTLVRLAKETGKTIHFFAFSSYGALGVRLGDPVGAIVRTAKNLAKMAYLRMHGVRLHMTATPDEFVQRLIRSKGLFTDSFHGLMFATIFEKECNVAIGSDPDRLLMSARLKDFTDEFGDVSMLSPEFDVSCLRQAYVTPKLDHLIKFSKQWLDKLLEETMR